LSDYVVSADTINTFKDRLDKFWTNQDVLYAYNSDLHGIGNRIIIMSFILMFIIGKSSRSVQCAVLKACDACADMGQL